MGLDIGSSSVRLLQLSRHGSSYRVDHFAIEPLPSGVIVEKSVQDVEAISDAIQSAVRNSGSSSKYCAVAVSGSAVFTKTISLPANLAEADIESQVQIEANQYIPYPLDEISLDFEVLGPSPRNADMVDILLAASKNENVESRQDALESLGRVSLAGGPPTRNGRPVRWGEDLVAGDLLEDRGQFIVMLADDGDGVLGPGDRVAQCWRRPAVVTSLGQAILDDAAGDADPDDRRAGTTNDDEPREAMR